MTMTEESLSLPPELLIHTARHAVYRCYSDQGELLYVGTTGHLGRRLAAHAEKVWFLQVRGITLEWYPDEYEAGAAERRAIHVEHPKYNIVHKSTRPRSGKPRNGKTRRRQPTGPTVPATETRARILQLVAEGYSASAAGRMAGRSDAYGRMVIRAAKKEPAGDHRSDGDMATGEQPRVTG